MSHSSSSNKHGPRAKNVFADIPKNEKGGILVTEDDISIAFQFLDKYKNNKITLKQLQERLTNFFPLLTKDELSFIMGDEKVITLQYLNDLLLDNTITHFDPVAETFKAYDPEGTGFLDGKVLQEVFKRLELPDITDEDLEILLDIANDLSTSTSTTSSSHSHHHSHHHHHDDHEHQKQHHHRSKKITLPMFRKLLDYTHSRKPTQKELGLSSSYDD